MIIEHNRLGVHLHSQAIGDRESEGTLYLSAKSENSNSLNPNFRKHAGEQPVSVTTLDAMAERGVCRPGLIKIDTETTEPAVLRGASKHVRETRPWIICEVLPRKTEHAVQQWSEEHGYNAYLLGLPLRTPVSITAMPSQRARNVLLAPQRVSDALYRLYLQWLGAVWASKNDITY
jgi:FkbM family methyltransferase